MRSVIDPNEWIEFMELHAKSLPEATISRGEWKGGEIEEGWRARIIEACHVINDEDLRERGFAIVYRFDQHYATK